MHRPFNFFVSLGFIGLSAISSNSLQQAVDGGHGTCATDTCIGNANLDKKSGNACLPGSNSKSSEKATSNLPLIRQAMRRAALIISKADNLSETNFAFSDLLAQAEELLDENNSLASRTISLAENFYAITQDAWFKGHKHGALEIAINPSIRLFNKNAGFIVAPEIKDVSVVNGAEYVSKIEYLSAINEMKSFVSRLLLEGSTNEQEIIDFFRYKRFLNDRGNSWLRRKISEPNLEEWALANPALDAKIAKKTADKMREKDISIPTLNEFYPLLSGLLEPISPLKNCF